MCRYNYFYGKDMKFKNCKEDGNLEFCQKWEELVKMVLFELFANIAMLWKMVNVLNIVIAEKF